MAQKREFDVSDMEKYSNTTVHRIVMEVSPIKVSRKNPNVKYFSEKITLLSSLHSCSLYLSLQHNLQSGFAEQSPHTA